MMIATDYPRDMTSATAPNLPHPRWPGDARICVAIRDQLRGGAARTASCNGGPRLRGLLIRESSVPSPGSAQRHPSMESLYEYGSRGRVLAAAPGSSPHVTCPSPSSAVASAMARNPQGRRGPCARPVGENRQPRAEMDRLQGFQRLTKRSAPPISPARRSASRKSSPGHASPRLLPGPHLPHTLDLVMEERRLSLSTAPTAYADDLRLLD